MITIKSNRKLKILNQYEDLDSLSKDLNSIFLQFFSKKNQKIAVGIDGPGGSGKSSLAKKILNKNPDAELVQMDDFDLPGNGKNIGDPMMKNIGENTDWIRLKDSVLLPFLNGDRPNYKKFDREKEIFYEESVIGFKNILIIEGVFAIRRELSDFYDLKIWVESEENTRLERVLDRDGFEFRDRWVNDWIIMENQYKKKHLPQEYADILIDTSLL